MACTMPSIDPVLAPAPRTLVSCSAFPSDSADYLDTPLSVWLGGSTSLSHGTPEAFVPLDLWTAANVGNDEFFRRLLSEDSPCDLNRRNKGGWTALMYAAYIGHESIVNLLLDQPSVDINLKSGAGKTALILAASCGNESIAASLIARGADVNATDNKGRSALFHSTNGGHFNLVKLLLSKGAHPDCSEPRYGFTPFMLAACEAGSLEIIVQHFLSEAARPETNSDRRFLDCIIAKNKAGDTARSLAEKRGHSKIVGMIDDFLRRLSSGDETEVGPDDGQPKTPSILDGPKAYERLVTNKPPGTPQPSAADDVDDDPFGNAAAVTIRSSSNNSSSKGLAAALGLETPVTNQNGSDALKTETPPNPYWTNSKDGPPSPLDLAGFLTELGLQKYIAVFKEQDVDLPVFLTMTDTDLKECGITLFGPRRKMTTAIARYHSCASATQSRDGSAHTMQQQDGPMFWTKVNPLERVYADKLEVEMQEMAIRLTQSYAKEKESLSVVQKTQRRLDSMEGHLQHILGFLANLHKSLLDGRKKTGHLAHLGKELGAVLQRDETAQCDMGNWDPAVAVQRIMRYTADVDSTTLMQINGIEDLMRRFSREEGGGGGST